MRAKNTAQATKKLKAELARARLERLARPKRPKRAGPGDDAIGTMLEHFVNAIKGPGA